MAMKDHLETVVPDGAPSPVIVTLAPQTIARIKARKRQEKDKHHGGSDSRYSYSGTTYFIENFQYDDVEPSDAATFIDVFCDIAKGAGMTKTWVLLHPDGNYYVVRFDQNYIIRTLNFGPTRGIQSFKLAILGNYVP